MTSQKAPSAKRCIKTLGLRSCSGACMRRQKAPSAKRCIKTSLLDLPELAILRLGQKAPSAKRCIKTTGGALLCHAQLTSQKAPSAKRCIKTTTGRTDRASTTSVRKHRAPKGALRPASTRPAYGQSTVRKHRAPKGALRQMDSTLAGALDM